MRPRIARAANREPGVTRAQASAADCGPPLCHLAGSQEVEGLIRVGLPSQERDELPRGRPMPAVLDLFLDLRHGLPIAPEVPPSPAGPEPIPRRRAASNNTGFHRLALRLISGSPRNPGPGRLDRSISQEPLCSLRCSGQQPEAPAGHLDTSASPVTMLSPSTGNANRDGTMPMTSGTAVFEEAQPDRLKVSGSRGKPAGPFCRSWCYQPGAGSSRGCSRSGSSSCASECSNPITFTR